MRAPAFFRWKNALRGGRESKLLKHESQILGIGHFCPKSESISSKYDQYEAWEKVIAFFLHAFSGANGSLTTPVSRDRWPGLLKQAVNNEVHCDSDGVFGWIPRTGRRCLAFKCTTEVVFAVNDDVFVVDFDSFEERFADGFFRE